MGLIERSERIVFSTIFMVEDGQYMCKSRTTSRDWFKCTRPEYPAHGSVMLCTVQCRPASACARKSPPRGCTLKKQDKTRQASESRENPRVDWLHEQKACETLRVVSRTASVLLADKTAERRFDGRREFSSMIVVLALLQMGSGGQ